MGCCLMASMESHVTNTINQQRQIAAQQEASRSSAPYVSATGEVIVPMNGMTGQFPSLFPVWLNGKLSETDYITIINKLNAITMPTFEGLLTQSDAMVKDMTSSMGSMNPNKIMQMQQTQLQQQGQMNTNVVQMTRNIESLLYEINTTILNGKDITLLSMLQMYANGGLAAQQQMQAQQMNGMAMSAYMDKGVKFVIGQNAGGNASAAVGTGIATGYTAAPIGAVAPVVGVAAVGAPVVGDAGEGDLPQYEQATGNTYQ